LVRVVTEILLDDPKTIDVDTIKHAVAKRHHGDGVGV